MTPIPKLNLLSYYNAKTVKGEAKGYTTFILYLAPFNLSGFNTCASASAGCAKACLNTAGMGKFSNVQQARIKKTKLFFTQRDEFLRQLNSDILRAADWARANKLIPCYRLNGTSDIRWETLGIFDKYPQYQFYDYTKHTNRKNIPSNYHLTFSRSELTSDNTVMDMVRSGVNVAVVFSNKYPLPATYLGLPVVSGDEDDLRFLDPKGVIIGLVAKGNAKKDSVSGFVVDQSALIPLTKAKRA